MLGTMGLVVSSWVGSSLCQAANAPTAMPVPAMEPAVGVMLVANRSMPDPRFWQTIILLTQHDDTGTVGIVINRPTAVTLADVAPEFAMPQAKHHVIYFGGPVALHTLSFFVRRKGVANTEAVLEGVYRGHQPATLTQLLASEIAAHELRLYAGYAGWAPGQLAAEIKAGGWRLFMADPDWVFHEAPDHLWEEFMPPTDPILTKHRVFTALSTPSYSFDTNAAHDNAPLPPPPSGGRLEGGFDAHAAHVPLRGVETR